MKRIRTDEKSKVIKLMSPWFDKLCDNCKDSNATTCNCEAFINLRKLSRLLEEKTIRCDFSAPLTMERIEYLRSRGYSKKDISIYSGEPSKNIRYFERHHKKMLK